MRAVAVLVAALALAPSAFAHAEVSPTDVQAGQTARLQLTVPSERAGIATVGVVATAARGLAVTSGGSWRGRTTGVVRLAIRVRAERAGDYPLRVRQTYADGTVVDWSGPPKSSTPAPVVHVHVRRSNASDRLVILVAVAVGALLVFALRRRR
jgi:hypothetical protein